MTWISQLRDTIFDPNDLKILLSDTLGDVVPVIHCQPVMGGETLQRSPIAHQRTVWKDGRRQSDQYRSGIDRNQLQITGAPADGPANAIFEGKCFSGQTAHRLA